MLGRGWMGSRDASVVAFVDSSGGSSADNLYTFTPSGVQAGDLLMVFAEFVAIGDIGMSGGTGTGWTKDSAAQLTGNPNWCQHKILASGDIGGPLTCWVTSNATPVRWAAYRNVATRALLQAVSSAAHASSLNFSAVVAEVGSSRLVAGLAEHGGGAGAFTAPAGWTDRLNINAIGPKLVSDIDTALYDDQAISFATSVTNASGQTGFLYELIGI